MALSDRPQRPARRLVAALRSGDWLNPRLAKPIALLMLIAGAAAYANWLLGTQNGIDPVTLKPISADFTSFWIAARTVAAGAPATAYDLQAHTAAQLAAIAYPPGVAVPIVTWSYPPSFLLLVAPFGLLPLTAAFAVWIVLTTLAFVLVVRRIAPPTRSWLPELAALGFPAAQGNLHYGQNGALTAALFGMGLIWLQRRPWLAGACFALLTCKPQLGLMLPVALLAGRHFRAFAATAALGAGLAAVSALLFGTETWTAFFGSLAWSRQALLDQGDAVWGRMPSLFAALRLHGAPLLLAYAAQASVALWAGVLLWRLWRGEAAYSVKAGSLAFATLAATPYLLVYDLVLLGIGIAWLVRDGAARGFAPWCPLLIALAWYLASICDFVTPLGVPVLPVLCLALLTALVTAKSDPGRAPATTPDRAFATE